MATIITQQPDALSFSGNLKKFIVSTPVSISVLFSMGATEIFDLEYAPGIGDVVEIDLRQIVERLLSIGIPTDNDVLTEQTLGVADFTAVIDSQEVNFRVLKGGVAELQSTATAFVDANFLTWQPAEKRILQVAPEWLGIYATAARKIKVKAYFADETDETILYAEPAADKLWSVNVSWAIINDALTTKNPVAWDVWIADSGDTQISYIQRFQLRNAGDEENLYIWCNTVGGIDSFSMTGYLEDDKKLEHKTAELIDESLEEYWTKKNREIKQNTGYLTTGESRWLEDFFLSPVRYRVRVDGAIKRIVLTESTVVDPSADDQFSHEFTYRYADDPALLNLDRTLDPLPAPEALADFFLIELLSGLTTAQYAANLLFAVQSPFAEGWQKLSFSELWEQALPTLVDGVTVLYTNGKLRTNSGVIVDGLKPKHGFEAAAGSELYFLYPEMQFSITAHDATQFPVWNMGVRILKDTELVAIENTVGTWYIYYSDDDVLGNILCATLTSWNRNLDIPIATIAWDGSVGVVKDYRYVYTEVNHSPLTRFEDKPHPAEDVYTDITNFNALLDEHDTDLQKVLDKLDDHKHWKLYTPDYLNGFVYTSIVDEIPTLNILGNILQNGSAHLSAFQLLNNQWLTAFDYAGNIANILKISKDNVIEFGKPVGISALYHAQNAEINDIVNIPLSSASASGKSHGVRVAIGGTNVMQVTAVSNGAGGISSSLVEMAGKIKASTFQMTMGATNGWFLRSDAYGNATWSAQTNGYKGTWDASTTIPSATYTAGDWYRVVVTSGVYYVGDDNYYNGTTWQRVPGVGYTLQTASASVLGGIKIGAGITMTGDVASVSTAYRAASWVPTWADITGTTPIWNQNTTGIAANVSGVVAIANGGTGAATADQARINLGFEIGTDISSHDHTHTGSSFYLLNNQWLTAFDYAGNVANIMKISKDNLIEFGKTVAIGSLYTAADSGRVNIANMPIVRAGSGQEMSYSIGINGEKQLKVVGIANGSGGLTEDYVLVDTYLKVNTIAHETTDVDKFLVSSGGVVKYRTGIEVLADIGAISSARSLTFTQGAGVSITNNGTAQDLSADRSWTISSSITQYTDAMADARVVAGITGKQNILSGTGFVKSTSGVISYDTNTYVTGTPWTGMGYVTGTPWTALGYITSSALSGYATQTWVGQQGYVTGTPWTALGYITSSALSGYATQTWVGQQGYVTGTPWTGMGYLTSLAHNLTGDVSGAYGANTVDKIKNKTIATLAAGFLKYDGSGFVFDASTYVTGTPWTGMGYVTGTPWTGMGYVTGTPWTGMGYVTGTPWTGLGYITSSALSGYATQTWVGQQGYVTGTPWTGMGYLTSLAHNLAGDVSGAYGANTVDKIKNKTIATLAAGFLKYDGSGFVFDASTYVTGTPWTAMGYLTSVPAGSANYIQNQYASAQTASMWISGNIKGDEVYRGSSREIKKNIKPFDVDAIDFLNKILICDYNLKSNGLFGIGFIAEDTHKWLSGEDQKSHAFGNHLGILTKAIQDEDKKVEELKNEVLRLKNEAQVLKEQVKELQDGRR